MLDYINTLKHLISRVRNPQSVLIDRLNLGRRPYLVRLRSGLQVELRPDSGDRFGFYEVMLRGDYTERGQQLRTGDTVVDVGANIGCFSILASSIVGPEGRVVAIEPEISSFQQLQKNIVLNLAENISVRRMALSNEAGMTTLLTGENYLFSSLFSSVDCHNTGGDRQEVPAMSISQLMEEEQIDRCDYLKLDGCSSFETTLDCRLCSLGQLAVGVV